MTQNAAEEIPLSGNTHDGEDLIAEEAKEELIEQKQAAQELGVYPSDIPVAERKEIIKKYLDISHTLENAPPEGRPLFFEDGERRIDYILVWEVDKSKGPNPMHEKAREIFKKNLINEGLEIEEQLSEERNNPLQFLKVHAPWELLTRYAEVMKIRMPMKEVPEEVTTASLWEFMSDIMAKLLSPFDLDPEEVPPVPKKFTSVFQRDKEYLFAIPDQKEIFFSHAQRSRIVDYILRRQKYSEGGTYAFGINRLLSNGVYKAAYPLHEGSWKLKADKNMRQILYKHWARWTNFYKVQPLDYVRSYFGDKIGLYFAWLGYYTYMLIPASAVGLAVFIYGLVTMNDNTIAKETCELGGGILMCPLCDKRCNYWNLSLGCYYAKANHLFDNAATVFFAIFMSFWGTVFLEFWKREESVIQFKWNLMNFEEEEEPPRPEYLAKLSGSKYRKKHEITGVEEPYVPFWRMRVPLIAMSFAVMMFMVLMAVGIVIGVIIYRMAVLTALYLQNRPILYRNATIVTSVTAALINLVMIFLLNFLYGKIAAKLTDMECQRTQSEHDSSLTFKLYCLQFVNYYSSIFYVAFFKGKFVGYPGDYNTFLGARQEECQPGGCLIELCIQLAIIMVGKQLLQNTLLEILMPRLKILVRYLFRKKVRKERVGQKRPWEKDYKLEELGPQGLFYEYLEMLLQYGFITIFVAAFPLAPLFALLNNMMEIRIDATKFTTTLKRPMGAQAADIGVWYQVLYFVSRLAIISNALIIALSSNFIPRLVYKMDYSPDGSLKGFVNNSLSYFNVSDFMDRNKPEDKDGRFAGVQMCRYRDFRNPPWDDKPYEYTPQYWHVLAARFIFVFIFENLVIFLTGLLAKLIPDMPRKVREQFRREAYLTNEIILKVELDLAKGGEGELTADEISGIRRRARANIYNRAMSEPTAGSSESIDITPGPENV